jgi:ppGpp synthetase/RelA/SpoT-type nucleotidyltranferase
MSAPFDPESFGRRSAAAYRRKRGLYLEFACHIETTLVEALRTSDIRTQSVSARAKTMPSFTRKAGLRQPLDPTRPMYPDPLHDITDLAGVRVIVFLPTDTDQVDACVTTRFEIVEPEDKFDQLSMVENLPLGYTSHHYLVRLKDDDASLHENQRFEGLIGEIQVRTILQHAWAEIAHDIEYKAIDPSAASVRRRFIAIAGMMEIADREFHQIQTEIRAKAEVRDPRDIADHPAPVPSWEKAAMAYGEDRSLYVDFTRCLKTLIEEALESSGVKTHSVEGRAKSVTSFARKAGLPHPLEPARLKYDDPLHDITDLAGVRVIAFLPGAVEQVCVAIATLFETLVDGEDHWQSSEERFGYASVHYLVKLKDSLIGLPPYSRFVGLVGEVQVRTIMQHAWAEIEHDIQYRPGDATAMLVRRRFMAGAGMLEIADREFQALQNDLDGREHERTATPGVGDDRGATYDDSPFPSGVGLLAFAARLLPAGQRASFVAEHGASLAHALPAERLGHLINLLIEMPKTAWIYRYERRR